MKVSISVPGTFHAFHLGEQLRERDALDTIYTTYPRFKLDTDLPRQYVHPVRHPEAFKRVGEKLPVIAHRLPLGRWRRSLFDAAVARNLDRLEAGLFVGYSGSTLTSLRRGNELGLTTVVERCSSHIRTQAEILDEEFRRFGHSGGPVETADIRREEQEYSTADYVITPSEFVYQSFLDHGVSEEKLLCEPYAVDVDRYTPSTPDDTGPTTYLFAGRVSLRKGIPYLLEAWDAADLPDSKLIVAGVVETSCKPIVDEFRDRSDISFPGWVDDMQDLYRRASAFVFPTLEEGSAYVTYEAMAAGVPVITTPHSGWVGEHEEHGLEVPIRDSEALASALETLHRGQSLRGDLGRNARRLIELEYTWDAYGDRVHATYEHILE